MEATRDFTAQENTAAYAGLVKQLTNEAISFIAKKNNVTEGRVLSEISQFNIKILLQIKELVQAGLSGVWEEYNK